MVLWVVVSTLPGIFSIFVFSPLNQSSSKSITTYFLLGGAIRLITIVFFEDIIENLIFNGKLSLYLLKPISFVGSTFVKYMSGPLIKFLLATPFVVYVAFYAIKNEVITNLTPIRLIIFCGALLGGYLLSAAFSFMIGFTSFWIDRVYFLNDLHTALVLTLSGSSIPLYFFPDTISKIIRYLPFPYMLDLQIRILTKSKLPDIHEFAIMFFYIFITWAIVLIMYKKGLRKYESHGN